MTVLVTGANGFIGTHVASDFASRGETVIGLTRHADWQPPTGVGRAVASDLLDKNAVDAALHGVDTVIHVAGRAHSRREGKDDPASECRRVNVDGTRALLESSLAAGVKRFVYMSSVKAVASESDTVLDEDTPPMPVDAYGASKLEAERLVRVVSTREGLHAPVLRLPLVYGTGMKSNMLRLFQAVERGVPLPLASVRNRRSLAYVGNVVEAIHCVLASPSAAHETFFVSDGEDLSTPDLVRRIAKACGRPSKLFPVPVSAFRAAQGAGNLLSRVLPFHFTLDSVSALVGSLFVDISKLKTMTGFQPRVSVDEGLAHSARHSGAAALVPR